LVLVSRHRMLRSGASQVEPSCHLFSHRIANEHAYTVTTRLQALAANKSSWSRWAHLLRCTVHPCPRLVSRTYVVLGLVHACVNTGCHHLDLAFFTFISSSACKKHVFALKGQACFKRETACEGASRQKKQARGHDRLAAMTSTVWDNSQLRQKGGGHLGLSYIGSKQQFMGQ
jgi:hypothetical protein